MNNEEQGIDLADLEQDDELWAEFVQDLLGAVLPADD